MGNPKATQSSVESLTAPTPWPNANARLLGLGLGLPMNPLDRLAHFSASEFERFTLEWASDYLSKVLPNVYEVQQRGASGDKGRDVVVWFDPSSAKPRRWSLYQCKHYDSRLGAGSPLPNRQDAPLHTHRRLQRPTRILVRNASRGHFRFPRPS